jgi:enoyl-CoA hydratase/carnithine racemase
VSAGTFIARDALVRSMSGDDVTIEHRDGATVVHLDDGKVNALSTVFLGELADRLEEATGEGEPVVLTGNGHAFSAGLDLEEVPTLERDGLEELLRNFKRGAAAILRADEPVVAALEGFAVAGGGIFALSCDHRVAHPEAEIGCTELEVGIPFPPTDLSLFEARLPPHAIRRTIVDPNRVSGQRALNLGWVDELDEDPLDAGLDAAGRIGGTNPEAFRIVKQRLNRPILETWDAFFEDAYDDYVELLNSKTTQQAILEGIQKVMG